MVNTFAGANLEHPRRTLKLRLIRDEVVQTDKTNNQVAARLCGSFGRGRGAGAKRRAHEDGLGVVETEGRSKDTGVATRSLK